MLLAGLVGVHPSRRLTRDAPTAGRRGRLRCSNGKSPGTPSGGEGRAVTPSRTTCQPRTAGCGAQGTTDRREVPLRTAPRPLLRRGLGLPVRSALEYSPDSGAGVRATPSPSTSVPNPAGLPWRRGFAARAVLHPHAQHILAVRAPPIGADLLERDAAPEASPTLRRGNGGVAALEPPPGVNDQRTTSAGTAGVCSRHWMLVWSSTRRR